jgi:hypothetical protein
LGVLYPERSFTASAPKKITDRFLQFPLGWPLVCLRHCHCGSVLLAAVGPEPEFADQILCMVAAGMLEGTGGIPDPRLRSYVAKRLSGDICPPKKGRGGDNAFRDAAIVGLLIPLLLAKGFKPTRNDSTEGECPCSILSKALDQIDIDLSEKRLSNLWARRVSKPKQKF